MSVELDTQDRILGYSFSFSYKPAEKLANEPPDSNTIKGSFLGMTVMNVLGYIPGVSLIVGIARIIFSQVASLFNDTEDLSNNQLLQVKAIQEAQLVRGALECCSVFAPLVLIADIVMTILLKDQM